MSILLDTPFNPGDLDPGQVYTEAKIKSIYLNLHDQSINIVWIVGNTVSGVWIEGAMAKVKDIWIQGEDYNAIVQEQISGVDNNLIYEGVKRVFYDYLLGNGHIIGSLI